MHAPIAANCKTHKRKSVRRVEWRELEIWAALRPMANNDDDILATDSWLKR